MAIQFADLYKWANEKSNKHIPKNRCFIIDNWNGLIDKLKIKDVLIR